MLAIRTSGSTWWRARGPSGSRSTACCWPRAAGPFCCSRPPSRALLLASRRCPDRARAQPDAIDLPVQGRGRVVVGADRGPAGRGHRVELSVTGPGEPAHRRTDLLPQRAGRPDPRRSAAGASGDAMVLSVVTPAEARRFANPTGARGRAAGLASLHAVATSISMRATATRRFLSRDASGAPESDHLCPRPRGRYRHPNRAEIGDRFALTP